MELAWVFVCGSLAIWILMYIVHRRAEKDELEQRLKKVEWQSKWNDDDIERCKERTRELSHMIYNYMESEKKEKNGK